MKHICSLLLFCSGVLFAQKEDQKEDTGFRGNFGWRIGCEYAVPVGDNLLAEGYRANPGFDTQFQVFYFKHLRAGIGGHFMGFKVIDHEVAGDHARANYGSIYGTLSYKYELGHKLILTPMITVGESTFSAKGKDFEISRQKGMEWRLGGFADYRLGKASFVFAGIFYSFSKMPVNTTPEYANFYSKFNQVQLSAGFNFD